MSRDIFSLYLFLRGLSSASSTSWEGVRGESVRGGSVMV